MAEYFGYVDHAVDSQVNWAEINKSVVGMIHDEQTLRTEKKVALDKMTTQLQEELAKTPTGINQDANKFASNYTSDATEQSLMNTKLLKSGVMKPKDFVLRTQNLNRDTNTAFDLAKSYQEFAKTTQERIDKGEIIANVDIYKGQELEKYANLGNTRAVFNATDGSVALGVFDQKTGKYTNVRSVSVLKSLLGTNTKAYDVDKSAKTFADGTGKVNYATILQMATTSRAGISLDISNPQLFSDDALKGNDELKKVKDNYIAAENGAINATLAAPNGELTVLMSKLGTYDSSDLTTDKNIADKDPSKVLIKYGLNGNVSLDETGAHYEAHKKESEDWLRSQMRNQIDAEYKKTSPQSKLDYPRAPTAGESDAAAAKQNAIEAIQVLNKIYSDPSQNINSMLARIGNSNPNIKDITRDGNNLTLTIENPDTKKLEVRTMPFLENGKVTDKRAFVRAVLPLLIGENVKYATDEVISKNIDKNLFNPDAKQYNFNVEDVAPAGKTPTKDWTAVLDDLKSRNSFSKTQADAAKDFNASFKGIPKLKVVPTGGVGSSEITFVYKNAKPLVLKTYAKDVEVRGKNYTELIDWLTENNIPIPDGISSGKGASKPSGIDLNKFVKK
jgi:hypothetical protein